MHARISYRVYVGSRFRVLPARAKSGTAGTQLCDHCRLGDYPVDSLQNTGLADH